MPALFDARDALTEHQTRHDAKLPRACADIEQRSTADRLEPLSARQRDVYRRPERRRHTTDLGWVHEIELQVRHGLLVPQAVRDGLVLDCHDSWSRFVETLAR